MISNTCQVIPYFTTLQNSSNSFSDVIATQNTLVANLRVKNENNPDALNLSNFENIENSIENIRDTLLVANRRIGKGRDMPVKIPGGETTIGQWTTNIASTDERFSDIWDSFVVNTAQLKTRMNALGTQLNNFQQERTSLVVQSRSELSNNPNIPLQAIVQTQIRQAGKLLNRIKAYDSRLTLSNLLASVTNIEETLSFAEEQLQQEMSSELSILITGISPVSPNHAKALESFFESIAILRGLLEGLKIPTELQATDEATSFELKEKLEAIEQLIETRSVSDGVISLLQDTSKDLKIKIQILEVKTLLERAKEDHSKEMLSLLQKRIQEITEPYLDHGIAIVEAGPIQAWIEALIVAEKKLKDEINNRI